jgi:hypothetical protein
MCRDSISPKEMSTGSFHGLHGMSVILRRFLNATSGKKVPSSRYGRTRQRHDEDLSIMIDHRVVALCQEFGIEVLESTSYPKLGQTRVTARFET